MWMLLDKLMGTKDRTAANRAELEKRLNPYCNRSGSEGLLVQDRDVPIAPIELDAREDYDAERLRLAAQGRLRLGSGEQLGDDFWNSPAPRISARNLLKAIDEDRKED